jgi:hypothetical protein
MNIRMNINASRFSSRITAAVAALVAVALTSILIASGIRGDIPTVAGLDHSRSTTGMQQAWS